MSMAPTAETGRITGTKDKDYDLLWYIESCLNNALRLETYRADAERENDTELAELFGKAQADSRKGAELGKSLLVARFAERLSGHTGAPVDPMAPGGVAGDRPHTDPMAPGGIPGDRPHTDPMAPGGIPGDRPHTDPMAPGGIPGNETLRRDRP